jgi:hypothetical protein
MARLGAIVPIFRAAHTVQKSPANVTPFDIIINTDEDALKTEGEFELKEASFGKGNAILAPAFSKEIG